MFNDFVHWKLSKTPHIDLVEHIAPEHQSKAIVQASHRQGFEYKCNYQITLFVKKNFAVNAANVVND